MFCFLPFNLECRNGSQVTVSLEGHDLHQAFEDAFEKNRQDWDRAVAGWAGGFLFTHFSYTFNHFHTLSIFRSWEHVEAPIILITTGQLGMWVPPCFLPCPLSRCHRKHRLLGAARKAR